MTAPAAPVITSRAATIGSLRLRWAAVTGAATYNVYCNGVVVQSGLTNPVAVAQCSMGDLLKVTAVNAGAEESVPSNVITVGNMGTAKSFPAGRPRGPYTGPFG